MGIVSLSWGNSKLCVSDATEMACSYTSSGKLWIWTSTASSTERNWALAELRIPSIAGRVVTHASATDAANPRPSLTWLVTDSVVDGLIEEGSHIVFNIPFEET